MNSCIRNDCRSGGAALKVTLFCCRVPISAELSVSGL